MMVNNNIILQKDKELLTYDVMHYSFGNTSAYVAARQTALEPAVAGVDRAMSWSLWLYSSNINTENAARVFACAYTAAGDQQYSLSINDSDLTDSTQNQKLAFVLFTDLSNTIGIRTTNRFARGRWAHVVITYDGSEANTGIEIYINGVRDATAIRSTTGTYTGAHNNSSLRFMTSWAYVAQSRDFAGDQRDLAIGDIELDQTKVDELYNVGVPIDVNTVSFYGANIEDTGHSVPP